MLYSYIALNAENQKLKGVINALDTTGAKKKLHNVGLSVLSLREADESEIVSVTNEEKKAKKLPSFVFFVIDPQGKELSGAIESIDKKNALRRLIEEYGFEVISLCAADIPEDLRYEEGKKGLAELAEQVEYEFGVTMKHSAAGKKAAEKGEDLHDEEFEAERQEILKEIEMVSKKTQNILKNHRDSIDTQDYTDIEHLLGDLIRLRFSNNLPLIRKLIESLFEKIGESMKKQRTKAKDSTQDYDEVLEEEKLFEEMQKSSGRSSKDVLDKLQGFSSILDVFSGMADKPKKKQQKAGFFDEVKDDTTFVKRMIKSGSVAIFTGNKNLREKRLSEIKKKWVLWNRKKETLHKEQEQKRQKEAFERRKKGVSRESQLFFFLLDELRVFTGALLLITVLFAFVALFIIGNNIPFERTLLERSIHSSGLISFTIGIFFVFFALVMQKKYCSKSLQKTISLLITIGVIMSLYFINL